MIVDNIEQRSLDWHRLRCGSFTGSKIGDLMKSGRKKVQMFGETALSYIYKVAAERMLNPVFVESDDLFADYIEQQQVYSKAIVWGQEQEDNAKDLLMRKNPGWELTNVSSCRHDTIPHFAASPDAIIYDRKKMMVAEIKCPNPNTYVRYLTEINDGDSLKSVQPDYYYQMMAEMACTGAESGVFVAYCPWLIKPIHIVHIGRDDEVIKDIEERVVKANEIVENIINPTGE
jgi:hypothetical protein